MATSPNPQRRKVKSVKAEELLGKALWREGMHFRRNAKNVYGCPSLALKSQKLAIFVDNDLRHGRDWNLDELNFHPNQEYCLPIIRKNKKNDEQVNAQLRQDGWTVLRFWETDVKNDMDECIENVLSKVSNKTLWTEKSFAYPNRTIRVATSFSGIGAIEYAFKRLGLNTEIKFAGDIEPNCKKTYFANHCIDEENWHTDVKNLDASPYKGQVDLLVGGAPCQTFSIVGERRGFEDTRGTLFREFARLIKECEPKVFIFENVQGLFKHDGGKTWEVIKNTFVEYCGYDVHYQLLNSKNYGIPQHRERLYCIGFKNKTHFDYPQPIELKYKMYDFLEDYTETPFFYAKKGVKVITPDKTRIQGLAEGTLQPQFNEFIFPVHEVDDRYYLSEKVRKYVLASGTKSFKTSTETDLNVARPLLQSMHKMHRAGVDNYVSFNKSKGIDGIRRLTPRECLRLMGFRDDFVMPVSNTAAYMEAGNSIVVDVLIALLKQMDITKYGE